MSMTAKQQKFLDEYLIDFNATEAAKRAGYSATSSHTTGWRLLRNAEILENVNKRIEMYSMGANERLVKLSDIARDKEEKTSDRLKAIEMLGKLAGDYTTKIEHSGGGKATRYDRRRTRGNRQWWPRTVGRYRHGRHSSNVDAHG